MSAFRNLIQSLFIFWLLAIPGWSRNSAPKTSGMLQEEKKETSSKEKKKSPEEIKLEKLRRKKAIIDTENGIREGLITQAMAGQLEEKRKLETEVELLKARLQMELAEMEAEKNRLAAENGLIEARSKKELAALESEKKRLEVEGSLAEKRLEAELAEMKAKKNRIAAENALAQETMQKELSLLKHENEKLSLKNAQKAELIRQQELQFQEERQKVESEMAKIKAEINLRGEKEKWKSQVNKEIDYLENPFENGILTISNRRISLNGPIIEGVADYVTKRIHYFNNQSQEFPIFIMIDRCPGGSVMEGYRIIKAMKSSKAPVHVVVKSFAASMAATITTVADHSYAYPNAIILHHQLSSWNIGNLTQQEEQLEILKEWARRLHEPVAEKMGIPMDELVKRMYEHSSDGDWEEFADNAQKLKWVDEIVDEIRETGITKKPTDEMPRPWFGFLFGKDLKEERDSQGRSYLRLPRLDPFDFYFIYNPDNYYR